MVDNKLFKNKPHKLKLNGNTLVSQMFLACLTFDPCPFKNLPCYKLLWPPSSFRICFVETVVFFPEEGHFRFICCNNKHRKLTL